MNRITVACIRFETQTLGQEADDDEGVWGFGCKGDNAHDNAFFQPMKFLFRLSLLYLLRRKHGCLCRIAGWGICLRKLSKVWKHKSDNPLSAWILWSYFFIVIVVHRLSDSFGVWYNNNVQCGLTRYCFKLTWVDKIVDIYCFCVKFEPNHFNHSSSKSNNSSAVFFLRILSLSTDEQEKCENHRESRWALVFN